MTDDDSGDLGGAPPKLTIGQRILTALPNLQRAARARRAGADADVARRHAATADTGAATTGRPTPTSATTTSTTPTTRRRGASDEPVARRCADGGRRTAARSLLDRRPRARRGRPVDDLDSMTREEITHRIKKLDDRERFLALTAAPFGVVVGVLLTAFTIHLNPPLTLHGKLNPKHVSDVAHPPRRRRPPPAVGHRGGVRADPPAVVRRLRPALPGHVDGLAPVRAALLGAGGLSHLAGVQVPEGPDAPAAGRPRRTRRGAPERSVPDSTRPGGGRVPANPRAAGAPARLRPRAGPGPGRRGQKEPAPTGPDAVEALHAARARRDPAHRRRRPDGGGRSRSAPSTRSAERSRRRISWRRRTSERGVGSSPRARRTSTSVIMPTTVE